MSDENAKLPARDGLDVAEVNLPPVPLDASAREPVQEPSVPLAASPAAPALVPMPVMDFVSKPPTLRPVFGAALIVAAVLVWSFVVLGTFTTSWLAGGGAPLSPALAFAFMVTAAALSCSRTSRRSRALLSAGPQTPAGRFFAVAGIALALFLVTILAATVVGKASNANLDALEAVCLVLAAAIALRRGDTMLGGTRLPASAGHRAIVLGGWLVVGVVTLAACVELLAEA